jgi:DNA (cytosine-5)-methyltransferase 1
VENVAALLHRGLGDVLGDLATIGYDAEWRCIPASKTGLPHRRDRLWIVAYPRGSRLSGHIERPSLLECAEAALPQLGHAAAGAWRSLDNVIDGLRSSDGLSVGAHRYRIKALGNTVCPQITEAIGRAIMKMEHQDEKKAIQDQTSASR